MAAMFSAPSVNVLDRLIGIFDPSRALKRVADRTRLARAYEAASPRDSWRPRRGGASAQADHLADASILRTKARALVQNVPYIATSMDALVANVIGTGITPRFTGNQAETLNKLFAQWSDVCDADGRLDFYGLEAAAYRAMEQDGEVLVRLRPRRPDDGLPVPLQLQLLEIDWLDSTRNSLLGGNNGVPAGNVVIEGIEYDPLGRVAAYWLWDQHPGDATLLRGFRNFSKRIDAANIRHLFDPKRPGQGRGITRLASVIARTRDLQLLEDAHLARKNLEARLSVLVSGDVSLMANEFQQVGTSSTGNADAAAARRTGDLGELASGGITELPAGNNVTFVDPKATPGHVDDVTHNLHIITAALGVTYEMATGDMSQVNFSSARVRGLDVRRGFEHTQWMVFIPRYCRPLADAFARAAIDAGKVPERTQYGLEYDTPKWDYVNPQQEANADALQVATGLSSLSAKLRARGENPEKVFAEIKSDFDTLQKLGVLDILFFLQKGTIRLNDPNAEPVATAAARQADQQAERLQGLLDRQADRLGTQLGDLHTQVGALSARQPVINVQTGPTNVTVPERSVTVEPAPVTNEVRVEGAIVNVPAQSAPVVNVCAAPAEVRVVNEVQPAPVTVAIPESSTTENVVERDDKGRIKRTTSTTKHRK
jgi:lambda family phage portal protein